MKYLPVFLPILYVSTLFLPQRIRVLCECDQLIQWQEQWKVQEYAAGDSEVEKHEAITSVSNRIAFHLQYSYITY